MIFLFEIAYGKLGHFAVLLSFVAAIAACISFFVAVKKDNDPSWRRLGRLMFGIHGLGIISIFGILIFLIVNHHFEYEYVWHHSAKDLPFRYVFSCFWEGQEGSFWLWAFWHFVLGVIIIRTAKIWESPVMAIISLVQVFLASMLLGIYFFGYKIGSNPFLLLKESMPDIPIFSMNPDYIPEDGNGLNPLLQNYWMTIHPPTLFLGFASTVVPFAFAITALWKKQYKEFVKPVFPWVLFSAMILGTGIMMGAAWAYEALSFGGFWAWDPVENASLVPWITMIAALHTLLAYKNTGHASKATFLLFIISFFLILYSTFLTRSGILGDTSVHSFTDLGMSGQLVLFMLALSVPAFLLLFVRWKNIPAPAKEETAYSREFWLFIGALVLTISAFQIIFSTSIPVINKLFHLNMAPPVDAVGHYNKWQLPVAVLVGFLAAIVQYFRYKALDKGNFFKTLLLSVLISLAGTVIICFGLEINQPHFILLVFASVFAIIANINYIFKTLKGQIKISGGSVAHIGFGLMLLGVLLSNGKREVISINQSGMSFGEGFDARSNYENVLLTKGIPINMSGYEITYLYDSVAHPNIYFKVNYKKYNAAGDLKENFNLFPNVQINKKMGDVANPDTRHYLTKDIYTHVTAMKQREEKNNEQEYKSFKIGVGDTIPLNKCYMILRRINIDISNARYIAQDGDLTLAAALDIYTIDSVYHLEPIYFIRDNYANFIEDKNEITGIKTRFNKVITDENKIELLILQEDDNSDYIIMKAMVFPYINVLWIGLLVLISGFLISIYRRIFIN